MTRDAAEMGWQCAWTDGHVRCRRAGSVSHGTRGEGPWYCTHHLFGGSTPEPELVRDIAPEPGSGG